MELTAIRDQLTAVFRALKPGGMFALQYASPLDPTSHSTVDSPDLCKGGGVLLIPGDMNTLVQAAGFTVLRTWEHSKYPQYGCAWHILHIEKAKAHI